MLNDRLAAAQDVAAHLFALEEAIDEALARAGALTSALPAARVRAKVAATVGQDAFTEVAASLATLVQARQHVVTAHEHLADTRDGLGLKVVAVGGLSKLRPNAKRALHIVATAG